MKLNITPFPSSQFTFNGDCFMAEASDLLDKHLQPLYDDAADVGFAIKSAKTGNVVVYVLKSVLRDNDEIIGWDYVPTDESIQDFPACRHTTASVFND